MFYYFASLRSCEVRVHVQLENNNQYNPLPRDHTQVTPLLEDHDVDQFGRSSFILFGPEVDATWMKMKLTGRLKAKV